MCAWMSYKVVSLYFYQLENRAAECAWIRDRDDGLINEYSSVSLPRLHDDDSFEMYDEGEMVRRVVVSAECV